MGLKSKIIGQCQLVTVNKRVTFHIAYAVAFWVLIYGRASAAIDGHSNNVTNLSSAAA